MDVDDMPVGQGSTKATNSMFESEFPDQNTSSKDTSNKSLGDRIVSKKWNERAGAYEELTEQIKKVSKGKDPLLYDHSEGFNNYLKDNNPGALEKAVDLFIEFIKKADDSIINNIKSATIDLLINKCISHLKPSLQEKGMEAICCIIENTEDFEGVSEAVCNSVSSTNVKAAQAGVNTVIHLIKWFGLGKFPLKKMISVMENAVGSKQATVRQSALNFYEECYKWIGESILPAVQKLNKPQQDELEKSFLKIKESGAKKPIPTRITKQEEEKLKQAEVDEICAKEEEEEKQTFDALDLEEEKDALAKFDLDWSEEVLKQTKWNEKKEKLEQLNAQINAAKIKPNKNLSAVMSVLEKLVKDSNMNVYDEVVRSVGYLAKGLKKAFQEEAKAIIGPIIMNIKKSPKIIINVVETLDKLLNSVELADLVSLFETSFKDKSPIIVKISVEFCQSTIKQTYIDELKKTYTPICPGLVKLANHSDNAIRDLGLQTIGLLKARIGVAVEKYYLDLNQQKLDKINESAAEIKLTKYDKSKVPPKKPAAKKEESKGTDVDGDAIMSFDDPKPMKKKKAAGGPPAAFLKRQQEMEAQAANKLEELKTEIKGGAPPKKKAAPVEEEKIAPSSEVSKAPKPVVDKPKVIVQDSGAGVLKEDAVNILTDLAPPSLLKQFDESKWQDKKEAYTNLSAWFLQQDYTSDIFEACMWLVKIKMKEWKEKNVNIVKGALQCISDIINGTTGMSKRGATIFIPFLSESVGDPKYKETCKENLLSLCEIFGPSFVIKLICKNTADAKATNIIIENTACMNQIINEFGADGLPVKEMINIVVISWDNKNGSVRNEAISLISTLYKHLGASIKTFLKDIKDSTLAVINKEFDQITPLSKGEFHSKREIRNDDAKQELEEAAGSDPLDNIPRTDVSKELGGQKLITMINDDNWKKRKEAVDKMIAVLEKCNMRILPNGLSELVGLVKVKISDSNKAVSKGFLQFAGNLASALGPAAKQYSAMLIKPLLRCLSEKNTLVRQCNIEAIDKWSQAIGPENIIGDIGIVISKDNPEIRLVLLEWMLNKKASIVKCDVSSLPKPLISCLQDKAPTIRSMAEKVIIEVLPLTGPSPFKKEVKDLKPAVQNTVKPILDKWIAEANIGDQEMEDAHAKKPAKPVKDENNESDKSGKSGKALPAALVRAKDPQANTMKQRPKTAVPMTAKKIANKLMSGGGKAKPEASSLSILDTGRKDKRNEADKKKRWHPEEIRGDYVEKFKSSSKSIFGEEFANKMFSADFKNHLKCIIAFKTVFENEDQIPQFLEVLDVVIKWAYIKSNEISNIAFLKELYNYFEELVDFLIDRDYQFLEAEGTIFCLCLVEKIGMNNNIMRDKVKEILMKVGNSTIFFPKKVMSILIKGLDSKNTKTTAECLEWAALMIQKHQLEVINDKDVNTIAKWWDSADNGIRQGALLACEEIYKIAEDQFWVLAGDKLSVKAKDIISARLNANLGIPLNSTPVEDRKESSRQEKSPMVGRNNLKSSGLNQSLNKSLNKSLGQKNKLNSSIPLTDQKRFGNPKNDRGSHIGQIQSSSNLVAAKNMEGMETPSRRKDSSVNRKLERLSSASRKNNDLDANLEKELDRIKSKSSDEVVQEILIEDENGTMELDENLDTVGKNIKQLKYGDLSGKVDALVIINELITIKKSEAEDSLIRNANFLICSISKVLYDVFNKSTDKVPLKFGKYFISIVNKVCSMKEIMRNVDENNILGLVEQLLLKLLIPGLDTLGERNEGQAMFRNLNNTILRILENCNPTEVFVVFLNLLKKYKGYSKIEKLTGIIVKCLLKVTRILDQLIDKINIERILLATHEYLLKKPASNQAKSDEVGIRITKTIVNELVKVKREEIWDYYGSIDAHGTQDIYIKKWIEIILMSLSGGSQVQRPSTASSAKPHEDMATGLTSQDNEMLRGLIDETQWGNQFRAEQAYKSLVEFTNDFPNLDFESYLKLNVSQDVYSTILTGIMKAKRRKQFQGKVHKNISSSFRTPETSSLQTPNNFGGLSSGGAGNRLSTAEKLQEYKNRLNNKQNVVQKEQEQEDPKEPGSKPEVENKLGGSIAQMNSSITEKWRKINSQGLKSHSGLNNTVGGGFKGKALQDKSTLDKDSLENEPDAETTTNSKMALQARLNEVKARLGQIKKQTHMKK